MHHISPVPDGFLVRVTRGKVLKQIFIAKGTPKARQRAIAARDELLANVPLAIYERNRPIFHTAARSNTGFVGLSYTVNRAKSGEEYEVIKASVRATRNRTKCTTFSINKWGSYEAALKAAYEWRENHLANRCARR
jgi:hypothetical protein